MNNLLFLAFCHVSIEKPANFESVHIEISDYKADSELQPAGAKCFSWGAHLKIKCKIFN